MLLSKQYLDTFETRKEIRDAIFLRLTIIRNSANPKVLQPLKDEIEQFKGLLKDKFNEDFED